MYYSATLNKTFIAQVHAAYKGSEFGPGLTSLVIMFYRDSGMTIPAIEQFLQTFDVSFPYRRVNTKQHSAVDPNSDNLISKILSCPHFIN